jgi:hypothetical protein
MIRNKSYLLLVKLFIALILIDFDGDFLLRQEIGLLFYFQVSVRYAIVLFLLLFGFLGFLEISSVFGINFVGQVCLTVIFVIFGYGLMLGLLNNNTFGAMREFIAISPICLIPIFLKIGRSKLLEIAKYLIFLLILIIAIKILLSQLFHVFDYGFPSWKIILRSSPLLLLPYIYFLVAIIKGDARKKTIFFLLIIVFEVFIAQARALNAALLLATFVIILSSGYVGRRIFIPLIVLPISAFASIFFGDGDFGSIFGMWSGSHFQDSAGYRLEQLDILIARYIERPLTGFGFGYYTVGYLTYGELANSFLLELDLINFSTKIGIPLSLLYVLCYLIIILNYSKIIYRDSNEKSVVFSFLLSFILLLFYSLFQTSHSGIFYWVVFAIGFSLIFEKRKSCG